MISWEHLLGICMGIGLSACCGFRVFIPLLALSLGAKLDIVPLAPGFEWLNSWLAVVTLSTATLIEIAAYYIPYVDHLLDTLMTPLSMVAGTLITFSTLTGDLSSFEKWTLALIAGGGSAGIIQAGSAMTRGASTLFTGGIGNFIVSTLELIFAALGSLLALLLPLFFFFFICILFIFIGYQLFKKISHKNTEKQAV